MDNDNNKNSVLIVDDEIPNIMILSRILKPEFVVYALKSGREAIEAAEKHLPDVILLDIVMPEMDGYETIAALKADERTKSIPVIFISGLGEVSNEERGLASGAADYILKPFSPDIVKLRIKNQIRNTNYRLSMQEKIKTILNFSETLLKEHELPDDIKYYIEKINAAGFAASKMR